MELLEKRVVPSITVTNPGDQVSFAGDTVSVAISAVNSTGAPLQFNNTGLPPGLNSSGGDGSITGTLLGYGNYTATVSATDETDFASVTFNWAVKNPVAVTNPGSQTSYAGAPVNLPIQVSDATGGTPAVNLWNLPPGLVYDSNTQAITGTVSADADTSHPYYVNVYASSGNFYDSQMFPWTLQPYPVTLTSPGDQIGYLGGSVYLTVSGNDATGANLWYTVSGLPDGLSASGNTISGTISNSATLGTPYAVTVSATDGIYTASKTVNWTVYRPGIWTGSGDGFTWNDAHNWSADHLPSATDDVIIGAGFHVHHDDGGVVTVRSLTSASALDFNGTLNLAAASRSTAVFNFTGNLDLQSGTTLKLSGGGALSGTFTEEDNSELDLNNGTFAADDGTFFMGAGNVMLTAEPQGGGQQNPVLDISAGNVRTSAAFILGPNGGISGAGNFYVVPGINRPGLLSWIGGSMTGTGTTVISPGAVVNAAYNGNSISIGAVRTVENRGVFNWIGGPAMDDNFTMAGSFNNYGNFTIQPVNNGAVRMLGSGTFWNAGGTVRQLGGECRWEPNLDNWGGSVMVDAGQLIFNPVIGTTQTINNLGDGSYFQAAVGTSIKFDGGTRVTFTRFNILGGTCYLFRGAGSFVMDGAMDVQPGTVVEAENFELTVTGSLQGAGTFVARNFYWTGGTMSTTSDGTIALPADMGVTLIPANGHMYITDNTEKNLVNRELRNEGWIEWGSANDQDNANDILVSNGGTITNTNSTFEVWNNQRIENVLNQGTPSAGKFTLTDFALFRKHAPVAAGTTEIQLQTETNNAFINAQGSVHFTKDLTERGALSQTDVGNQTFRVDGNVILAGIFRMDGGTLDLGGGPGSRLFVGTGTTFEGRGTVSGGRVVNGGGDIRLTGDLTVSNFWAWHGDTHLGGHTLTGGGTFFQIWSGTVYMEGGTLTFTGGGTSRGIVNYGTIYGPGTFNANWVRNTSTSTRSGRIIMSGWDQAGRIVVNGNFQQTAGASLTFELGGTQTAQYGRLTVTGQATLAGSLNVVFANDFWPDPTSPDTFRVLDFTSIQGQFGVQTIDLGYGRSLDVNYIVCSVYLVTR